MPDTANQAFFDALIRHQVFLLRFSGSVRNRIQALLDRTEEDLRAKILTRLDGAPGGLTSPTEVRRLETLLAQVTNTRTKAWDQVDEEWARSLTELALSEPATLQAILITTAPVVIDTVLPSARLLKALVTAKPFEGRTLKQWAKKVRDEDITRIQNAVRVGMASGETPSQIAARVVGSARLKGSNGVTQITRTNAEAITRTAVNHFANEARNAFFDENKDIVSEERFVATLDARTTPVCRANDGKVYPRGKGPKPPLHFNCRSLRVAVLDGQVLGQRPAKPVTEQQLLREFSAANGFGTPASRSGLPHGTKAKYDAFSRKRIRELTGRVPADTTYQQWLTRQPASFQDDVLGKTKGALFRRGGLTLDRFVNRKGDELTLQELARRHAQAFRDAGLDPAAFR